MKGNKTEQPLERKLPASWLKFLRWFCPASLHEGIAGDILEQFQTDLTEGGERRAKRRFIWNVIRFMRPGILFRNKFSLAANNAYMLTNHFKIALRQIRKQFLFSGLNMTGLGIAFGICIILVSYILQETSVNADLKDADRQYFIESVWKDEAMGTGFTTFAPLAKRIAGDYPHLIKNYYRFHGVGSVVTVNNNHFSESVQVGDPSLISMFGFELNSPQQYVPSDSSDQVLITEEAAMKFFGHKDVEGERIRMATFSGGASKDYTIGGVIKQVRENSILNLTIFDAKYSVIVPMKDIGRYNADIESWQDIYIPSYLELQPDADPHEVETHLNELIRQYGPEEYRPLLRAKLAPLKGYHLVFHKEIKTLIQALGIIVVLVWCMSVFNFLNSIMGKLFQRTKEMSIRKAIGAKQGQVLAMYVTESFMMSCISFLFGIFLFYLLKGQAEIVLGKSIPGIFQLPPEFWVGAVSSLFAISALAGAYAMWTMSRMKVSDALKNSDKVGRIIFMKGLTQRTVFNASQLFLAFCLGITTLVIIRQVRYFLHTDVGYDKDNVIVLRPSRNYTTDGAKYITAVRDRLTAIQGVKAATVSFVIPDGRYGARETYFAQGNESVKISMPVSLIDENFFDTYNVGFKAGSSWHDNDYGGVIINESAAKAFGWENDAVGRKLGVSSQRMVEVIGVVKDFHLDKLQHKIEPYLFYHYRNGFFMYRYVSLSLDPGRVPETMERVKATWKDALPDTPFDPQFMSANFESLYKSEIRLEQAAELGTGIGIIILLLGAINITMLTLTYRTKETGIRKVLGASVSGIIVLFVKSQLPVIVLASALSVPIAYYLVQEWLSLFAYHIELSAWMFVLPVTLIAATVIIITAVQSIKAALRNPVDSLRYE